MGLQRRAGRSCFRYCVRDAHVCAFESCSELLCRFPEVVETQQQVLADTRQSCFDVLGVQSLGESDDEMMLDVPDVKPPAAGRDNTDVRLEQSESKAKKAKQHEPRQELLPKTKVKDEPRQEFLPETKVKVEAKRQNDDVCQ